MISGKILRDAIISGANNINNQRSRVDELNVFPVPDGDTGTNMGMTRYRRNAGRYHRPYPRHHPQRNAYHHSHRQQRAGHRPLLPQQCSIRQISVDGGIVGDLSQEPAII